MVVAVLTACGAGGLQRGTATPALPGDVAGLLRRQRLCVADEQGTHQARHVNHHQGAVAVLAAFTARRDGAAAVQAAGVAALAHECLQVAAEQRAHQPAFGQQQAEGLQMAVFAGAFQRRKPAKTGEVVHGFEIRRATGARQAGRQNTWRLG